MRNNVTFKCPLFDAYCGPLYEKQSHLESNYSNSSSRDKVFLNDDPIKQQYLHLCHYFRMEDSVKLRPGIPGISSSGPILGMLLF